MRSVFVADLRGLYPDLRGLYPDPGGLYPDPGGLHPDPGDLHPDLQDGTAVPSVRSVERRVRFSLPLHQGASSLV